MQFKGTPVFIYALIDPETDEPRYIGQTVYPRSRLLAHQSGASAGKALKSWVDELRNRNLKPRMQILVKCGPREAEDVEMCWITQYRNKFPGLLNVHPGRRLPGTPLEWPVLRDDITAKMRFRCTPLFKARVRAYCERSGRDTSGLIRVAVEEYLRDNPLWQNSSSADETEEVAKI